MESTKKTPIRKPMERTNEAPRKTQQVNQQELQKDNFDEILQTYQTKSKIIEDLGLYIEKLLVFFQNDRVFNKQYTCRKCLNPSISLKVSIKCEKTFFKKKPSKSSFIRKENLQCIFFQFDD